MRHLFVLLLALSSDAFAKGQPCATEFAVNPTRYRECKKMMTEDARLKCFKKIFAPGAKVSLTPSGEPYAEITTNGKFRICINGLKLEPAGMKTYISYVENNQTLTISGVSPPIRIGRFQIIEGDQICNITKDGKITGELIPEYNFLPNSAKLQISIMKCEIPSRQIYGNRITLAEPTTVCDLKMPAGTTFGYDRDGAYHFTAVANGVMKVTDGEIDPTTLDVEKGKDYRNLNPIKAPCDWSETPPNVLDPLNEEE